MTGELDQLRSLLVDIRKLRARIVDAEASQAAQIARVLPRHRYSATNLVHYVALRSHDMRDLQTRLTAHGLSSLGRTESHVLAGIDALPHTLEILAGQTDEHAPRDIPEGTQLLVHNAALLLGDQPTTRPTRIMVTLPSEAATDPMMVRRMVASGTDIVRINCAHDEPASWAAMVANIHAAEVAVGSACLVSMDLAGPKLRTGPIQPGPAVLRVKPLRDDLGDVVQPAFLWLGVRPSGGMESAAITVPLQDDRWAAERRVGEQIRVVDARGARRTVRVVEVQGNGCLVSVGIRDTRAAFSDSSL